MKSNLKVYPVILTKEDVGYTVYVPDLKVNTQGDDLAEAIGMARDVIGITIIDKEEDNIEIPEPTSELFALEEGQQLTLVDIDIEEYKRKNDNRAVKKNCTIPNYLALAADKEGLNYSRVLQDALRDKLGLN